MQAGADWSATSNGGHNPAYLLLVSMILTIASLAVETPSTCSHERCFYMLAALLLQCDDDNDGDSVFCLGGWVYKGGIIIIDQCRETGSSYSWICKIFLQFRCWEISMWVLASLAFILHDALFWNMHPNPRYVCIPFLRVRLSFSFTLSLCIFGACHFLTLIVLFCFLLCFIYDFFFLISFFGGKPSKFWIFYIHNIL